MANRSYLYTTDYEPARPVSPTATTIGVSEWNYDIPLAFRILLSGNPRECHSCVFGIDEKIAIISEVSIGVERLLNFVGKIERPEAMELVEETKCFFTNPKNIRKYFVLECGEIFEMTTEDFVGENQKMIESISTDLENETARVLAGLNNPPKTGFLRGLFVKAADKKDPLDDVYALGLGNWTDVLYYEPLEPDGDAG